MSVWHVVATDGLAPDGQKAFGALPDVKLTVHKAVDAKDVVASLADASFVIIRSATKLTRDVLAQLPKLKGIVRAGVGVDNIDLNAASELGLWVWNAPTGNFQATAELAIGLLFAVARKIPFATEGARRGEWRKKDIGESGRQLAGAKFGVYGSGNIGLRVARMARALGMDVAVCDPFYKGDEFPRLEFDAFLASRDFMSIHSPLLDSTRHAFNAAAFAKMKPSAILVNAARGGIVDEKALLAALKAGQIAGVGLDVFEKEPFGANDPTTAELLADARVVATPHIGASTLESQRAVSIECAERIGSVIAALKRSGVGAPRALNAPKNPRLALEPTA